MVSRASFRQVFCLACALVALLTAGGARADGVESNATGETRAFEGGGTAVVLYTVAPGASVLERYGHSLLCLESKATSRCFDFGIFSEGSVGDIVRGSLEGRAMFVPQEAAGMKLVGTYRHLDRTIEKQVLPLSPAQAMDLARRLDRVVKRGDAYAYHPTRENCSTKIRDLLDTVSGGGLHGGSAGELGPTFRQLSEAGFSGRPLLLLGTTLFVGSSADSPTTLYERAFLPASLRDLVQRSWSVPAQKIYEQSWTPLPTSVHAGRGLLILLGVLLALSILFGGRRSERLYRTALGATGLLWGLIGLVGLGLRVLSPYPEFSTNWVPLTACPTDMVLGLLPRRWRLRYVAGRVFLTFSLVVVSQAGMIAQPLLGVGVFVLLPLGAIVWTEQGRRRSRRDPLQHSRLSVEDLSEVA